MDYSSPGQMVLKLWQQTQKLPLGKRCFAWSMKWFVPYSGALGAVVEELEPGRCVVRLDERRAVRNHLRSVHALALANLGELVSGLAMLTQLSNQVQGIVVRIDTHYHKKARGRLLAECQHQLAPVKAQREEQIEATIRDSAGETVATVKVTWTLRNKAHR